MGCICYTEYEDLAVLPIRRLMLFNFCCNKADTVVLLQFDSIKIEIIYDFSVMH